MSVSSDVAEQVVRLSLNGIQTSFKIVGKGAVHTAKFLNALSQQSVKSKGKTTLEQMLKSEKELSIFSIPTENLGQFIKAAKPYGLLYTIIKEKGRDDGLTDIFVKKSDAPRMNRILDRMPYETPIFNISEKLALAKRQEGCEGPVYQHEWKEGEMVSKKAIGKALFGQIQQNPDDARATLSHPFAPSSKREKPSLRDEKYNPNPSRKPSVKAQLDRLQKKLYQTAKHYEQTKSYDDRER